jgi:hypothetical protein
MSNYNSGDSVDISSADLSQQWKSLTNSKEGGVWIAFSQRENVMEPFESGNGGIANIKQRMKMNTEWQNRPIYGAFTVEAIDRRSSSVVSNRLKFICFTFIGSGVSELERANSSFQKTFLLNKLFPSTHLTLELNARLTDFTEIEVARKLHHASAAHKPNAYGFGAGKEIAVELLEKKEDGSDEEFDD